MYMYMHALHSCYYKCTCTCRFEIEDVEEPSHHISEQDHGTSDGGDLTTTSFGYNTTEAVPMTVYYRHSAEDEGKPRPTLDHLREGRKDVPHELVDVSDNTMSLCSGQPWDMTKCPGR